MDKRSEREAEKERLKAYYRADLEARKKFLQSVNETVNESRLADALFRLNQRLDEFARLTETTDEMAARLNSQSATVDAKLELAFESRTPGNSVETESLPPQDDARSSSGVKTLGDSVAASDTPFHDMVRSPKKTFLDLEN
jgi:hypothetical protein